MAHAHRLATLMLTLSAATATGCGPTVTADPSASETDQALDSVGGTALDAEGAFTCDFSLPGAMPLGEVPPAIERDRMYMAERPGMLHKQLPIALDFDTGNLFSGGRYLFDTEENAAAYRDWVQSGFVLDGVPFLSRPVFIAPDCHSWSVIGARELAPIDHQVVLRTERFSVPGTKNERKVLAERWPSIAAAAEQRGLSAVWLVYNRQEQLAEIIYYADRLAPNDPTTLDFASLFALQYGPPLGALLSDLEWPKTFDRTHWILTIWFPFVAGDQGPPSLWPYSPPLPQPFCGDGVCEVSRGESGDSCGGDCPVGCGDALCQVGEDTHNCPGDCRL